MKNDRDQMVKIRDAFQNITNACDEMLKLEEREAAGETGEALKKDYEAITGRYVMLVMELQSLQ